MIFKETTYKIVMSTDIVPSLSNCENSKRFLRYMCNPHLNLSIRDVLFLTPETFFSVIRDVVPDDVLIKLKDTQIPRDVMIDISDIRT